MTYISVCICVCICVLLLIQALISGDLRRYVFFSQAISVQPVIVLQFREGQKSMSKTLGRLSVVTGLITVRLGQCRQLGFPVPFQVYYQGIPCGSGNESILTQRYNCQGNKSSVTNCSKVGVSYGCYLKDRNFLRASSFGRCVAP